MPSPARERTDRRRLAESSMNELAHHQQARAEAGEQQGADDRGDPADPSTVVGQFCEEEAREDHDHPRRPTAMIRPPISSSSARDRSLTAGRRGWGPRSWRVALAESGDSSGSSSRPGGPVGPRFRDPRYRCGRTESESEESPTESAVSPEAGRGGWRRLSFLDERSRGRRGRSESPRRPHWAAASGADPSRPALMVVRPSRSPRCHPRHPSRNPAND